MDWEVVTFVAQRVLAEIAWALAVLAGFVSGQYPWMCTQLGADGARPILSAFVRGWWRSMELGSTERNTRKTEFTPSARWSVLSWTLGAQIPCEAVLKRGKSKQTTEGGSHYGLVTGQERDGGSWESNCGSRW